MCRDPVEMKATAGAPHVHDHSGPGTGQGSTHKHAPSGPQTAPEAGPYTCPMHPEVRHEGPGSCPKCGMALEPLKPMAADTPNEELADMKNRFWSAVGLSTPIFVLEMVRPMIH